MRWPSGCGSTSPRSSRGFRTIKSCIDPRTLRDGDDEILVEAVTAALAASE